MVPRIRRRREWPLRLAAVFATAGVLAMGIRTWLDDRRSASLASVVRTLRAPRADDDWTWCTSTIAEGRNGFVQRYDQGFRVFEVRLSTQEDVGAILDLAGQYAKAHWLLVLEPYQQAMLKALVVEAHRRGASLLDRIHPAMRRPEDLAYALRLYPFPSVAYAPTDRQLQTPAMAHFVSSAGAGVVVLPRDVFTPQLGAALVGAGARAYVAGVNDSAEAQRLRDWGAVGVVTDSLPAQVTCDGMEG